VLLRFRDGSTEVVDPGSDSAAAMHTIADRLREQAGEPVVANGRDAYIKPASLPIFVS
jgi:hypothetical protein